jgi:hypothetical protein
MVSGRLRDKAGRLQDEFRTFTGQIQGICRINAGRLRDGFLHMEAWNFVDVNRRQLLISNIS